MKYYYNKDLTNYSVIILFCRIERDKQSHMVLKMFLFFNSKHIDFLKVPPLGKRKFLISEIGLFRDAFQIYSFVRHIQNKNTLIHSFNLRFSRYNFGVYSVLQRMYHIVSVFIYNSPFMIFISG